MNRTISSTTHKAGEQLHAVAEDLEHLAPSAFSRAAAQMEALTQRSLERARDASHQVRDQAQRAGDRTVDLIQHAPVKSVLIAVAAGAAVALLGAWFARSRGRL